MRDGESTIHIQATPSRPTNGIDPIADAASVCGRAGRGLVTGSPSTISANDMLG